MKALVTIFSLLYFAPTLMLAAEPSEGCPQMNDAATAVARINNANFAAPTLQEPEAPSLSDKGQVYSSQFDAYEVLFKTVHGKKDGGHLERVAVIKVAALRESMNEIVTFLRSIIQTLTK